MWRRIPELVLVLGLCAGIAAQAQLDPEKRSLFQLGFNQPVEGRSPIAGYAFYYLNQPGFLQTNLTLRLAVAPVYVDSEIGVSQAMGPGTDIALGLAGGGFADSYSELRWGKFWREESFTGHGAKLALSLYHCFNPEDLVPLNAIVRASAHQSVYQLDPETAPDFTLPNDQSSFDFRTGLRWGGRAPLMLPEMAMELSAWFESQLRSMPGAYGFAGDRYIEAVSHLYWTRALFAYTLPECEHNFSLSATMGGSIRPDRFSAYRLGGVLPLGSEFPLNLPGYYFQEISAQRFALVEGQYLLPLDAARRLSLISFGGSTFVDYLPGLEQPGNWHSGAGGGLIYQSSTGAWQIALGYGYGFDAIRSHGRGAHSVGLLCQFNMEARERIKPEITRPRINLNIMRGFDWLLGR